MSLGITAGAWAAAAGAIGGGLIAANGAKSAARTSADAADHAGQLQNEQFQQTRADQAPYRDAGYTSLAQLSKGTVDGGEFNRNFSMADYTADPGYTFRLKQGEQGINRAAVAGGGRYSGATLKALAGYNSGMASQEYGNAYNRFNNDTTTRFNRLASISDLGHTATAQTGAAGAIAATNQGSAIISAGNARASGYVGVGNAVNGTIGSIVNRYQQYGA